MISSRSVRASTSVAHSTWGSVIVPRLELYLIISGTFAHFRHFKFVGKFRLLEPSSSAHMFRALEVMTERTCVSAPTRRRAALSLWCPAHTRPPPRHGGRLRDVFTPAPLRLDLQLSRYRPIYVSEVLVEKLQELYARVNPTATATECREEALVALRATFAPVILSSDTGGL